MLKSRLYCRHSILFSPRTDYRHMAALYNLMGTPPHSTTAVARRQNVEFSSPIRTGMAGPSHSVCPHMATTGHPDISGSSVRTPQHSTQANTGQEAQVNTHKQGTTGSRIEGAGSFPPAAQKGRSSAFGGSQVGQDCPVKLEDPSSDKDIKREVKK